MKLWLFVSTILIGQEHISKEIRNVIFNKLVASLRASRFAGLGNLIHLGWPINVLLSLYVSGIFIYEGYHVKQLFTRMDRLREGPNILQQVFQSLQNVMFVKEVDVDYVVRSWRRHLFLWSDFTFLDWGFYGIGRLGVHGVRSVLWFKSIEYCHDSCIYASTFEESKK
jgi:hypothetical protein